jgi:hypothetical protein
MNKTTIAAMTQQRVCTVCNRQQPVNTTSFTYSKGYVCKSLKRCGSPDQNIAARRADIFPLKDIKIKKSREKVGKKKNK